MLALVLALLACTAAPPSGDSGDTGCVPTEERCNGADDDCDGAIDELFDLDADGFLADEAACRALGAPVDCDDLDAAVNPAATERCGDGIDQDCSGAADDGPDADGDGAHACDDCDDADGFAFPGAAEACNGLDDDCDGAIDQAWDLDGDGSARCPDALPGEGDCDDTDPARAPTLPELCNNVDDNCDSVVDEGFDADGDGWRTCRGDCDDADASAYPTAEERCDGVDNDCDAATTEHLDLDLDGLTLCDGDCDDTSAVALPGGVEVCDGLDNDCDGRVDPLAECWSCVDAGGGYSACALSTTWSGASEACATFGAHLAVAADAADNAIIGGIARDVLGSSAWFGLTDLATEGVWAYEDGTVAPFTQWWSGEPNDSGGEDCAGTGFGDWGWWNDYGCSSSLPFICEL
ncbi:MAG: MopE-related protein [Pseudomonadota bacterium]|nr:MopE-related protein [Pseudomonadota bacterium]